MKRTHPIAEIISHPLLLHEKVLSLIPALIAVYNLKTGQYIFINEYVKKILGYNKRDFLQGGITFATTLMHPDDIPRIVSENRKALRELYKQDRLKKRAVPFVPFEFRMRHKNGSYRWLLTEGVVFQRDVRGKVSYVMNISIDITKRKEQELTEHTQRELAERALRDSERRYKHIFHSTAISIFEEDFTDVKHALDQLRMDGVHDFRTYFFEHPEFVAATLNHIKIIDVNSSTIKLFEARSKRELLGSLQKIFLPETIPVFTQELVALAEGKNNFSSEAKLRTLKGKTIHVLFTMVLPNQSDPYKYVLFSLMDITERKRLEQQKDEFIGIASHELKTPVTSIKAYTQVLQKQFFRSGDTKSEEILQKVEGQINKLTYLIRDLLDVTKIETGKLQFHFEIFDYNALVLEIVDEVQQTTQRQSFILTSTKPYHIKADRDRIGQVLINLLTNAVKYSPGEKQILIKTDVHQGFLRTSVQDFGVGIPKNKQRHIFERFFRVDDTKTNNLPGLGLGLYIAAEIVRRHGGSLTVDSKLGKGATFTYSLPL
jgi:PAS domain S-box-containing protein